MIYIALYVDDMLVKANATEEIEDIYMKLSNRFKIKDMGNARFNLGIEVSNERKEWELKIKQESSSRRMAK